MQVSKILADSDERSNPRMNEALFIGEVYARIRRKEWGENWEKHELIEQHGAFNELVLAA